MSEKKLCLLCGQELSDSNLSITPISSNDTYEISCLMCGRSRLTWEAKLEIDGLEEQERVDLASWVQDLNIRGRKPPTICSSKYDGSDETAHDYRINQILETLVPRTFAERLDRIMENLGIMTGTADKRMGVSDLAIYACHASSVQQMYYYLNALEERQWLRKISSNWGSMQITPSGWMRIDALRSVGSKSDQAFIAMSFKPALEPIWRDGLYEGIKAAGYRPIRVDKDEHNEKICDRIIAEIRRSAFLVADVTRHRQGVYFEAGYAMGLGIPVIWTCQKREKNRCHFDTRQYNHIFWETPEELAKALEHRIRATYW